MVENAEKHGEREVTKPQKFDNRWDAVTISLVPRSESAMISLENEIHYGRQKVRVIHCR